MQPDGALTLLSRAPATLELESRRNGRNGHDERHGHAGAADTRGQGGGHVFHGRVGATVVLEDGGGVMAINVSERSARPRLKLLQLASIARPGCHANVARGWHRSDYAVHTCSPSGGAFHVKRHSMHRASLPWPVSTLGSTPPAASGWVAVLTK